MSGPFESSERERLEEARQLQRWVRRYAQNRSLPVMVFLGVFTLLCLAIGVPSYWGGVAYRAGNIPVLVACLVVVIVAVVATIFLSVPRWGGRLQQRMAEALYAREGSVTISTPRAHRSWLIAAMGVAFGICVVGSVVLGHLGYLPTGKYMQPISALYVVPFMVALNFIMRPMTGYIPLLWPLLYSLHAALIVSGVPIVFVGRWESLNMLVPTVGYGLLTSLIGHIYSRWALHNARAIVSRQLDRADLEPDGDQA
jgi:hypothetical protein